MKHGGDSHHDGIKETTILKARRIRFLDDQVSNKISIRMITGIAHVNLTVTPGTLEHAEEFYAKTLGLIPAPVPELQKGTILW